jgi:hypothetical protein
MSRWKGGGGGRKSGSRMVPYYGRNKSDRNGSGRIGRRTQDGVERTDYEADAPKSVQEGGWGWSRPKTHIKRQVKRLDCLPSLLGDGDKLIEIVTARKKIFCTGPTRAAKAGQKSRVPA